MRLYSYSQPSVPVSSTSLNSTVGLEIGKRDSVSTFIIVSNSDICIVLGIKNNENLKSMGGYYRLYAKHTIFV